MTPGVYLHLDFSEYLAVDALGSSDMKTLLRAPADWWYDSRYNLDRVRPDREKHFILGSALHAILLEGEAAYNAQFSVAPDPREHPHAARTIEDLKTLLDANEIAFQVSKMKKKSDFVELAVEEGLGQYVWDAICEAHTARVEAGASPLSHAEHNALLHMSALVQSHPEIGPGLLGGMSEVSVFWHREGADDILYRARFDTLAKTFSGDLKSMSNWQGRDPAHAAIRQIVELEYDIQATLYQEAREELRKFVKAGKVWTGGEDKRLTTEDDMEKIKAIAASDSWVWIWLFQQLRDDTGTRPKAPVLIPRFYRPSSIEEIKQSVEEAKSGDQSAGFDMMTQAWLKIEKATANYRSFRDTLGFDTPWMHVDPNHEILDEQLAAAGLAYKGV